MTQVLSQIEHRPLSSEQRAALVEQGCTAADWSGVQVEDGFDPGRVRRVRFAGQVRIGRFGDDPNAGLVDACIADCRLSRGVRVANVGVRLAGYDIADGGHVEDVGLVETRAGAAFGNGVDVEVLNEAGGRPVVMFNELSAQFAHLMCVHRHRPGLADALAAIARSESERVRGDVGRIGAGARVRSVREMVDVHVGPGAVISGAARLVNGSVLSRPQSPTTVGAGVEAEDFIIAESSSVTGGAILTRTFVGQGCRVGKQFSAENCLFFANCELMHGEAVCVFGGPFTVTHHKSTLLIAGLFSFFNAGSGTNQSNHMYKLGPVHEGKVERGSKTGSFSYMMWPCRVGPFSVVLGKHTRNFDASDLPFSLVDAGPDGRCWLVPGLNLITIGTIRDGAKWPTRDQRKGPKRDRIHFDVFSPYTVGRMIRGTAVLSGARAQADADADSVHINGADVKRVLLRKGEQFYRSGIELYLLSKTIERAERRIASGAPLPDAFAAADGAHLDEAWLDIAGQLMPRGRLDVLCERVAGGAIRDAASFEAALDEIAASDEEDEWAWVKLQYGRHFECDLDRASPEDVIAAADRLVQAQEKFLRRVLVDARKEFSDQAQTGFGHDGTAGDAAADFERVRGTYEDNAFVKQMNDQLADVGERVRRLKLKLKA